MYQIMSNKNMRSLPGSLVYDNYKNASGFMELKLDLNFGSKSGPLFG